MRGGNLENPGDEKETNPVEPAFPGIQRGTGNSEGKEIPIELTIFANPVVLDEAKCDLNDDAVSGDFSLLRRFVHGFFFQKVFIY